jgi:hypothetical protein
MYAAGGGFGGALLAILVAKILSGPCCCPHHPDGMGQRPATLSSALWTVETPDAKVEVITLS